MTNDEIKTRLQEISASVSEARDANAHCLQDQLWLDTLKAIANGAPNPVELAKAAIEAEAIEFSRFYE